MDERSFPNPKLRDAGPRAAAHRATAGLIAYKAFADLAAKGSLFLITIVAARRLAPDAFGVFSLGSTLGWLLAVAADCGIQLHLARAVARTPSNAGALLAAWLRARLWTTAATLALAALAVVVSGARPQVAIPLIVLTVVYATSGLVEFLHHYYRGLSRTDLESTLTLWQRGATLAAALAALAWRPEVTTLALAMLIPAAATLAVSMRMAGRLSSDAREPGSERTRPSGGTRAGAVFARDVWPIGAGILLSAMYFRVDVFLVQAWVGVDAVGLYNAVFRLVEALRLFPAAVLAVLLPALVRARDVRPIARIGAALTAGAIVASVALWVTADWSIAWLYGDRYRAAVPAFRILLLALPFLALNNALTMQLVAWDGQRAFAALCLAALGANLALNARLIPALSIEGAAWATLGTEIVLTVGALLSLAASRRDTRQDANTRHEPFFCGTTP